uniref:DUF4590 domain-containing protein n=4 Tax=Ciona intestinalis TaxID=7719 RepID=F7B249_CIOIN
MQQHCGGENLCVYSGKLLPGDNFTVVSQRHRNFPFSLTFYLNGIQAERLSACCEYKHRKGHKLGAKTSHFGFVNFKGANPCYKCLVAQGQLKSRPSQEKYPKQNSQPWKKRKQSKPVSRDSYDDDFDQESSKKTTDDDKKKSGSSTSSSSESDVSSVSSLSDTDAKSPTDRSAVTSPKPTQGSPKRAKSPPHVPTPPKRTTPPKSGTPNIGSPKAGSPKVASPKSTSPRSASPPPKPVRAETPTSPTQVSPPAEEISSESSSSSTNNPLVKLGI